MKIFPFESELKAVIWTALITDKAKAWKDEVNFASKTENSILFLNNIRPAYERNLKIPSAKLSIKQNFLKRNPIPAVTLVKGTSDLYFKP